MSINRGSKQPDGKAGIGSRALRNLLSVVGLTVALAATLFVTSGHLDWVMAWVYVSIRVGIGVVNMLMIASNTLGC